MKNINKDSLKVADDEQINILFKEEFDCAKPSEKRVNSIVHSARQETGVRDLLTHLLLRIWIPIISMSSMVFVLYKNSSSQTKSNQNKSPEE